ncbi:MAG: hypothetical protein ACPGYT_00165 [Nitrospirales bacterium]
MTYSYSDTERESEDRRDVADCVFMCEYRFPANGWTRSSLLVAGQERLTLQDIPLIFGKSKNGK